MIDTFELRQRHSVWWILLLEGLAAFILGVFLLFSPVKTIQTIIVFAGLFLVVDGIILLIDAFSNPTARGWKILSGIVGLLAGIILIRNPLWSALLIPFTAIIYLAIISVINGIIQIIVGFRGAGAGPVATGVVLTVLGIVLFLAFPLFTIALPFVLGACAIIGGLLVVILALRMRAEQGKIGEPSF